MVAVNHVTMLALSLASLSLTDAAAVNARPSAPDSPSKPSRLHASPLPMPMKRMVDNDSPSRRQRTSDAMSKRSQKSRTTEATTPLRKAFMRRQKQASFRAPRSDDSPAGECGHVDVYNDDQKVGQLVLNDTQKPYTLDASQKHDATTLYMVSSGNGSCTIQRPIDSTAYCATFDPCPPKREPKPLTMTPCSTDLDPHSSQTFSCDSTSGIFAPRWMNCPADTAPLNSSAPTVSSRATKKSVTLVFAANKPSAPVANEADVFQSTSASASASTSYVATETITTTVTASAGASSTPSSSTPASTSSPSVLAAQVDAVSSSTDSVSQTASSSSATDSSVPSASSSVASASSSAVPTPGALAVEAASASASAIPSASSSAVSSSLSDSSASPAPSSVSSVAASTTPSAFAAAADPSVFDSASATSSALGSASVSDAASTSSSPSSSDAASASSSPSSSAADVEPTAPLDEQAVYVGKARGAETPQW